MHDTSGNNNARVIFFPRWPIYCFLSQRGENVIRRWLRDEKVERRQIANFQAKIDSYERGGPEVNPGLIVGPVAKDIYKMRIKGNKGHVQLRPMVCHGPFGDSEVTLLLGAIEKDSKLRPENCKIKAQEKSDNLESRSEKETRGAN